MKIGILGGGLTGVCLQHFLKDESEVLEKDSVLGGLCRTFYKEGFGYDIGGHILFSKNESINTLVDKLLVDNINQCKRANVIFFKDRFVKYPFENDLAALNDQDRFECLLHYIKNEFSGEVRNLEQWSYNTFGKGISEKYFLPYNQKIWNIAPSDLSLHFVERIPKPPLEDVIKSALGISTEGYLHQLYFRYPRLGGAQALVQSLIKEGSQVECNFKVSSIKRKNGEWIVSDGAKKKHYDKIIIAFPIHEAIECFEDVPDRVKKAVSNLRYNTINVVMLGVDNESLMDRSAIYIPDPEIVTHRLCYMGFFSPSMVPQGRSNLIAEITTNVGDGVHELSPDGLVEKTIDDLNRVGLIRKKEIVVTDSKRYTYGYPVYNHTYEENSKIFKAWFNSIGVDLCGRFAQFEYINSDEVIRRSIELATKING